MGRCKWCKRRRIFRWLRDGAASGIFIFFTLTACYCWDLYMEANYFDRIWWKWNACKQLGEKWRRPLCHSDPWLLPIWRQLD